MTICRKIKDRCAELGITYSAFYQRITVYGWDYEKALTTPNQRKAGRKPIYFYNGEPVADVLKRNGIKYTTFLYRVKLMRWSVKKAIETPLMRVKGKDNAG